MLVKTFDSASYITGPSNTSKYKPQELVGTAEASLAPFSGAIGSVSCIIQMRVMKPHA